MSQLKTKLQAILAEKETKLLPTNIRAGVTVMGVEGNLEPDKPDQNKTVTPSTQTQNVVADTGYELAQVTVNGVTSAIDNNIQAANIKKDVTILGVTGTLEEADFTGVNVDEDCVLENTGSGEVTAINASGKFRGKILNAGGIDYICLRDDEHPADGVEYVDNGNDNDSYVLAAWNDITKLMPDGKIPDNYSQKGIFIPTEGHENMTEVHINQGHLKAAIGLTAEKIVQGNTILGVAGTAIPEDPEHADYDDCVTIADEILGVDELKDNETPIIN